MANKNNVFKFGFLIVVILSISFIFYKQYISTPDKENKVEPSKKEVQSNNKEENLDINEIKKRHETKKEEENQNVETKEPTSNSENDSDEIENYKTFYINKYDEDTIVELENKTKNVIEKLFDNEVSKKTWLKLISKNAYNENIKEKDGISLNKFEGQTINDITISPIAPYDEKTIMFEAMINWSYTNDDEQVTLVYFVYDPNDKKHIVQELNII